RAARRRDLLVLKGLVLVEFVPLELLPWREGIVEGLEDLGCLFLPHPIHEVPTIRIVLLAAKRICGAVEDSVECVIIGRRNRIELMVVAARATNAEAEHRLPEIADGIFEGHMPVGFRAHADTPRHRDITRRYGLLPMLLLAGSRQ